MSGNKKPLAAHGSTLFLRAVVFILGIIVLIPCIIVFPGGIKLDTEGYDLVFWGMYATAVPFFIALYQTLKLLGCIDNSQAFSPKAVRSLKYIQYCALTISVMYTAGLPYIFTVADRDDAPGVIVAGFVLACASLVIAVFAAVLQKLLQSAIDIKSEHDLTV